MHDEGGARCRDERQLRATGLGRIPATPPGISSADETADVGIDLGTPVVEAIGAEARSRLTGRIPKVNVRLK